MKVYYDSSLWDAEDMEQENREIGKKQRVNWQFEYLGRNYIIPCIYRFSKGIVMDIINPINEKEFEVFMDQYRDVDRGMLSRYEQEKIELESPFKHISINQIWINGQIERGKMSSSGQSFIPKEDRDTSLLEIKEAYSEILKDDEGFNFTRVCIDYPTNKRGYKRLRCFSKRTKIKRLKLITNKQYRTYPIEKRFTLSSLQPEYELTFTHPITKQIHKLAFKWEKQIEIPHPNSDGNKIYGETATYQIIPPLEGGEVLQFDQSMQYVEREDPRQKYMPTATNSVSIGIIGGARKPTASCVTKGREAESIKYCCSQLSEDQNSHTFYLEAIHTVTVKEKIHHFSS